MDKSRRQAHEAAGRAAENHAALWLRLRGYKVLAQRYKTVDGEIDIIARKKNVLACVEVKQRSSDRAAQDAVTYASEQRIMAAAERYITANPDLLNEDFELRFDILYVKPKLRIEHIKDAFRAY